MKLGVFTNEALPAFKVGDGIIFTTDESSRELSRTLKVGLKEKEFEDETQKGLWAGSQLREYCFTGTLQGRDDDCLTVSGIRGPDGELVKDPIRKVEFRNIVGVLQEGENKE